MPYIITTRTPEERFAQHGETVYGTPARRAVATLEEARITAQRAVHQAYRNAFPLQPRGLGGEHSDAQRAHRWASISVSQLPEDGGTIGSLPDGTVIEVRQVGWEYFPPTDEARKRYPHDKPWDAVIRLFNDETASNAR